MKKLLCIFLCLCLLPCGGLFALAAEAPQARLYNVYGSGMLFRQNAPAIFAGEAPSGSRIEADLINAAGETAASGNATRV